MFFDKLVSLYIFVNCVEKIVKNPIPKHTVLGFINKRKEKIY